MPAAPVSTRLTSDYELAWLVRWDKAGRQFIGLACLFPDCMKVVPRYPPPEAADENNTRGIDRRGKRHTAAKRTGAPRWFCSKEHADEAENRRAQLVSAMSDIEERLRSTPRHTRGSNRRELESDLAYLGRALAAYPNIRDVRPAAADRGAR